MPDSREVDVAIIGGGPAGSTVGTLLCKYDPGLKVTILEKEKFPRDHIGESQLPTIGPILDEMEVWDKVEAAGFPVKIGASYTWGRNHDRWNFDFFPVETWRDEPRPGRFEGQRRMSAFQVDRSIYDDILLRHASEMGCDVRQQTLVREIRRSGDRIEGLQLESGEVIAAKHYVDASGAVSLLRRALGVETWAPTELRNVAFWDYWQDAEWAVEIGTGATRIQIRSLPYGWIWFIPLGPTRTSIGLVTPAAWYRDSGKEPEQLYREALESQPQIAALIESARCEGKFQSCRDWSNLPERSVGENWFLAGESAGFADPILSAGMTLAHTSAREVAYTILELERGKLDANWLRERYAERTRNGIMQHIRFAQYWYAANSCFTDLKDNCARIATEAGFKLTPEHAWQWLSLGGFSNDNVGLAAFGSFDVATARRLVEMFDADGRKCEMLCNGYNVFRLNLNGAKKDHVGVLSDGRIDRVECYRRGDRMLPISGYYERVIETLNGTRDARTMMTGFEEHARLFVASVHRSGFVSQCLQALEVMIQDGWVQRSRNQRKPMMRLSLDGSRNLRYSEDEAEALKNAPGGPRITNRLTD